METKQKLETALKEAMRANDAVRKATIRMALTNIKLAEVEKGSPLEDNAILGILQKEIKGRREAISDAEKANRPDLIANAEAEIVVLNEFLPKQLTPEELTVLANAAIQEVGASSPADMGKVMKVLMPRVQGRIAGDQVSQVLKQLLQKS
ncbi:MAG: GatB/YqeY domain-containing protein [Anaerolineaceae bacterium]